MRGLAAILAVATALPACGRRVEISDVPPLVLEQSPVPRVPDSGIPALVTDELSAAPFPACADRETEIDCQGANDYPCDFDVWFPALARDCQRTTGCLANGWLSASLDDGGCFIQLGMTEPQDEFLACLVAVAGMYRCPCTAMTIQHFLGIGHDGCVSE